MLITDAWTVFDDGETSSRVVAVRGLGIQPTQLLKVIFNQGVVWHQPVCLCVVVGGQGEVILK